MTEEYQCICGHQNVHTRECKRHNTMKKHNKKRREKRKKLRTEHRCIICGEKVKPIIVYHQYCKKHKPKKLAGKNLI